ncbi:PIN domain-containing protein [Nostoc sp. ChiSLP03a]|uniref:PIN domain-containing protein n=1 Tax=Nostoc sp. ChiSLP03a TaxID=3075380 RepID=UPI003918AA43
MTSTTSFGKINKSRASALSLLNRIVTFCQVATVDSATINMALTTNFADFEDAIQYSTAILNHLDAIITRNPGDFPVTTPRILTPQQLIQELTNSP